MGIVRGPSQIRGHKGKSLVRRKIEESGFLNRPQASFVNKS
jgi:hypothetical protein